LVRQRRRRRGDRGFTLIELLISMGLSMVGLLGLMSLQMVAIRGNMSSRAFTEATSLAQERQEFLMTEQYADLTAQAKTESTLNAQGTSVTGGQYTRITTVAACPSPLTTCYDVTVEVKWNDFDVGATKTHSVKLFQRRVP
jgi:prepilin-type N-terminal cleavage/methylation domain-containing protein